MSRANSLYTNRGPTANPRNKSAPLHNTKLQISRLDAQVKHLIEDVLPKAPYLISVPSDVPYRHNSRFVSNWHLGTPFAKEEEPLQYMSFLTHQDGEQSLIKAVGGWSDEKGNLVDEDPSPQQTYPSTSNSPSLSGQRKKISLTDYKSKGKGGEEANRSEGMAHAAEQQSRGKDSQVNGVSRGEARNGKVTAGSPPKRQQDRKRSFDNVADASSNIKSPKPEKRARTKSPVKARSPGSSATTVQGTTNANKTRVPSLLSPTLPPAEADNITSIPELLSPTLPSSIEDLLAHNDDEEEPNGTTNHKRSDSVKSILTAPGPGGSPLSASKKTGISRTDHERHLSPSLQIDMKEARISPGARSRVSTSSPGPRQRHIIVLKYGKRNKKRVEALLKFAPRSKKPIPKPENATEDKHDLVKAVNGTVNTSNEATPKREKEGPTSQPSEAPLKRAKLTPSSLNLSERPTTPIPSAFKSPSVQNPIPPRSAFSTPKKDFKTTAMRRVESSDGIDARTPTASMTRQSTPGSIEKPQTSNRTSSPTDLGSASAQRDDTRRGWKALSTKYYELGRKLKHEGQSLLHQETPDQRHGVLLHVEALLCFMLNQVALSYANSGSDSGWRTILPYLVFVHRVSMPFPHLQGIVSQLGAVCRQTISKHDLDRLAREPLPVVTDDLNATVSAPTPSSDGNTKSSTTSNEDATSLSASDKARRKWTAFRSELIENAKDVPRAWLDGYQKLSPEVLKQHFPDTWDRRARDASLKANSGPGAVLEKGLSAENLRGHYTYFLPLDVNTGVVEAVRFGRAILQEWAAREVKDGNIKGWNLRVDL